MLLHCVLRLVIPRPRCIVYMLQNSCSLSSLPSAGATSETCKSNGTHSDLPNYEETIKALNTLQSNAASIRQSIINKKHQTTLEDTLKYLRRSGLSLKELDKLSVIHVAGTKGKGSTCAITESILRSYGVKTGFFSSPHLIAVTERIRINGEAIPKKKFINAFWKVFRKLQQHKESENDMPAYFKFLTIMCFHVFLDEKVDVAILEVGIGGEYDSTNIVRNTSTIGITSLGLEHTNILGDTIEDIAWQKAGIIKPHSTVYTNVQLLSCLKVIEERTAEKTAKLIRVPDIADYHWPDQTSPTNFNKMIQLNGSLAIQLAYNWLREHHYELPVDIENNYLNLKISNEVLEGLKACVWAGRCQTMSFYNFTIFLDGAHTVESINVCTEWFQDVTKDSNKPRILIFNTTGDRDSTALLKILHSRLHFDLACFVPNIPLTYNPVDDIHSVFSNKDQLQRAQFHASKWRELCESRNGKEASTEFFTTILDAFLHLKNEFNTRRVDVLVTGSIHLLGATILALDEFDKCFK